ncbi:diaminopimelate epimerase [Schistosoma japonicum]|nr:diaminopimelate epimerase [Schistosoma japonicum]
MKLLKNFRRKVIEIEDVNVGDLVNRTREKHHLMTAISGEISNLVVLNKKSTNAISEVLKALLQYLNSNTTCCSMIFPFIRDLECAHYELTDTLNKLLPEPIIKQMAKYKHLEPQLRELESSAQRVNRHKRNLDQTHIRGRSSVKKEKAHINYRASSMDYDYLTHNLVNKMNTVENEGTMACCDALFVLVSTYKQFSDRIYPLLTYLFDEVNKLHESAARSLNTSYARSLLTMENAAHATKWKASSIMSCQDGGGSMYRSSSTGRMMSSDCDPTDHRALESSDHNPPSVVELRGDLLKSQRSSVETNSSIHSYRCRNRKLSSKALLSSVPTLPPQLIKNHVKSEEQINTMETEKSLPQENTDKTICKATSVSSSTTSNEIIDMHNDESLNDITNSNNVDIKTTKTDDTRKTRHDISNKNNVADTSTKEQLVMTNNLFHNSTSPESIYSSCRISHHSNQQPPQYNCHHDFKAPTVESIYSTINESHRTSLFIDKSELSLPIKKLPKLRNTNYAIEKSSSNMINSNKNEVSSFDDKNYCYYSYGNDNENSCIPITVHKDSWSNTSPINNNDDIHELINDPINYRTAFRESLLSDNELKISKHSFLPWGCLPSPITEEEDE